MTGIVTIITAAVAFGVTAVLGIWLVPFLRRVKYGQTINDIGPTWHQKKQGTPTMGGLLFMVGVLIAAAVGMATLANQNPLLLTSQYFMHNVRLVAGIVMAFAFGFIGFVDDYIKVVKKRNLGLTASQKMLMQILVATVYLGVLYLAGDTSTILPIPFLGQIDLGIIYYPFCLILIVGFVNAVNLTDGIDGLASSVTFVYAIVFMLITSFLSSYGMNILATALAGAMLGFLMWNFYPAKVFMGDTGSMFLGGLVVALAFGIGNPALLILAGIIYLGEALSVILQVISFKTTGKRIFKMSPIHHHFEMSGYSEIKIDVVFSLVGLAGGILAILSVVYFY